MTGTAFQNPDGTIGLGFNVVAAPGGAPSHIDATVTLPAASGTWRDIQGNSGSFVLTDTLTRSFDQLFSTAFANTDVQVAAQPKLPEGEFEDSERVTATG